ncbi:hypothetical protein P9A48_gp06 [Xanthomonas phage Mallos]|uniref:Uncharacterized protein n=1 Tax=Xanthomonas phage Mallos TaxID=2939131 RepID=A0A9E7E1F1_9CAUD|nr:hypothetical protein P9A48_gp06 [Xanthomonas phage Mallos]URA07114.1 hypothetical protein Mallos_BL6006 [Xanthomonas phage Mallos]
MGWEFPGRPGDQRSGIYLPPTSRAISSLVKGSNWPHNPDKSARPVMRYSSGPYRLGHAPGLISLETELIAPRCGTPPCSEVHPRAGHQFPQSPPRAGFVFSGPEIRADCQAPPWYSSFTP